MIDELSIRHLLYLEIATVSANSYGKSRGLTFTDVLGIIISIKSMKHKEETQEINFPH